MRHTCMGSGRSAGLALGVLIGAAACGGEAVTTGSGAGASGGNSSSGSAAGGDGSGASGTGGSATGGGGGSGFCPAAPPANGTPCVAPPSNGGFGSAAHCSWGDDPRPTCRVTARCTMDDTWEVTQPSAACDVDPLPATCPDQPPAPGVVCADATLACWYPGQNCFCSDCQGGSAFPICQPIDPPQWACREPATGCPQEVPQAGDACTQEGLDCGRSCELPVVCTGGYWVYQNESCPMCASPHTPIATPHGERAIADLRAGDLVFSVHDHAVVAVPLLRVSSTVVVDHTVQRVTLRSGAMLDVSPGHPTADGRTFADLTAGAWLDNQLIIAAELVPFEQPRTYDILPDSDTHTYFAAGAQIGTTLHD